MEMTNPEQLQRAKEYFRRELLSTLAYENPINHCERVNDDRYDLLYSSKLYSFQRSAYIILNYPDSSAYDSYCRTLVTKVMQALEEDKDEA